jgi:hypothetical protein
VGYLVAAHRACAGRPGVRGPGQAFYIFRDQIQRFRFRFYPRDIRFGFLFHIFHRLHPLGRFMAEARSTSTSRAGGEGEAWGGEGGREGRPDQSMEQQWRVVSRPSVVSLTVTQHSARTPPPYGQQQQQPSSLDTAALTLLTGRWLLTAPGSTAGEPYQAAEAAAAARPATAPGLVLPAGPDLLAAQREAARLGYGLL